MGLFFNFKACLLQKKVTAKHFSPNSSKAVKSQDLGGRSVGLFMQLQQNPHLRQYLIFSGIVKLLFNNSSYAVSTLISYYFRGCF